MKKILVISLVMILLSFGMIFAQEIPAPFAKAKEMALKIQPDALGRYLLNFEVQDVSYTFYIIGYLSKQMIIGIGKTINGTFVVAEYHEQDEKFTIYIEEMGRREIESKKVIDFAFQIFRELVERKLI